MIPLFLHSDPMLFALLGAVLCKVTPASLWAHPLPCCPCRDGKDRKKEDYTSRVE